jgi:hypothetical protein
LKNPDIPSKNALTSGNRHYGSVGNTVPKPKENWNTFNLVSKIVVLFFMAKGL